MAQRTTCTQLLSELAEQYDRSTLLLAQLEEALQSRTSVSSTDAPDAWVVGEDRAAGRAPKNARGSLACELANLHLQRHANGSPDDEASGETNDDSHGDAGGGDIGTERRPPRSLALLTSHSMHNTSRDDARRDDDPPASAPIVRRRTFCNQPMVRSPRRTTTVMHNRQESREVTQHQLLLSLIDEHRRASDTNPTAITNPSNPTSTNRCLSEPLMAGPDCIRRPSLSNQGPLALNGVSLVPTASFRAPRLSPLQRTDSPTCGSHDLLPGPWSVGGVNGGSGSPGARACPLLLQVGGGTAAGAAATASPPWHTVQLDGDVAADNNNNSSSNSAAAHFLPLRSESSFGCAAAPGKPRLGPQQEACSATFPFEAVGSALGAFAPTSPPAAPTPLLPAVNKRRPRGCTEYGGWRTATSYMATAGFTD